MTDKNQESAERVFSRPINVEKIKSLGLREHITANEQECKLLAQQLDIKAVKDLSLTCVLMPWKKGGVQINGEISATIEEICVVTLEPFTTQVRESVERIFERAGGPPAQAPVLDLESIEDDVPDVIDGGSIDIGEIAVETLALSLSAYPRKPGAVFQNHMESDPDSNDDPAKKNPFDVLKQLKKH